MMLAATEFLGGVSGLVGAAGGLVKGVVSLFGGGNSHTVERQVHQQPDPQLTLLLESQRKDVEAMEARLKAMQEDNNAQKDELESLRTRLGEQQDAYAQTQLALEEQRQQYLEKVDQFEELLKIKRNEFEAMANKVRELDIRSLDELQEKDEAKLKMIFDLCATVPEAPLQGGNVALLAQTSCGKSTLTNALTGRNDCETGIGETTRDLSWNLAENGVKIWDTPGYNDVQNYFSELYISHLRAMSFVAIMVTQTIYEIFQTIRLLDHLEIPFCIVVNKTDLLTSEEIQVLRAKIETEIRLAKFRCYNGKLFFMSGKRKNGDFEAFRDYVARAR